MSRDAAAGSERPPAPSAADGGHARLRRWQAATEWPLTAISLLFLVAYAIPIARPDAPPEVRSACSFVLAVTWLLFVADYLVRARLAPHPWRYVRRHPLELAVVVLPVLRPLLLVSVVVRLNRVNAVRLRGRVVRFAAAGTALLVIVGALTVTQAERGAPGASIVNLGDGFWWAMVTITTVGYGDLTPVTATGRVIAVCLMVGGIALLGVVTATLSSWLVERVTADPGDEPGETPREAPLGMVSPAQVALLVAEVQSLRAEIVAGRRADGAGQPRDTPEGRADADADADGDGD
ncbi:MULTISPECIES: potassium channel family protein [unclassified Isoptericola]|uniref:potassium channel family protein n=1 Tax=unclassified Isoptericola TaxID=2623355 RepID=UPI003658655E